MNVHVDCAKIMLPELDLFDLQIQRSQKYCNNLYFCYYHTFFVFCFCFVCCCCVMLFISTLGVQIFASGKFSEMFLLYSQIFILARKIKKKEIRNKFIVCSQRFMLAKFSKMALLRNLGQNFRDFFPLAKTLYA